MNVSVYLVACWATEFSKFSSVIVNFFTYRYLFDIIINMKQLDKYSLNNNDKVLKY